MDGSFRSNVIVLCYDSSEIGLRKYASKEEAMPTTKRQEQEIVLVARHPIAAAQWLIDHPRSNPDTLVALAASDPMMAAEVYLNRRDLQSDSRVRQAIRTSPDAALVVIQRLKGEYRDPEFIDVICRNPAHAATIWLAFDVYRTMPQVVAAMERDPAIAHEARMQADRGNRSFIL